MDALPREIAEKVQEVRRLCEKYGVKRLTLVGSAASGTFDPQTSDLDFLVELQAVDDPIQRGRTYLALWDELEGLFGRAVDLIDPRSIENPYVAASIQRNRRDLYEAA